MPVTFRFDSNIVVIDLVGEYSMEEIPATVLHSLADSNCPATPCILINLSNSLSIAKRTSEDVKHLALSLVSLSKRFNDRIALVAPKDFQYGLMRMGSVFTEAMGIEPQIFRNFADARQWLLS